MTGTRSRLCKNDRRGRGKRDLWKVFVFCASIALRAAPLSAQLTVDRLELAITPSPTARVVATFVVRNPGDHPAQATITREDWDRAENGENRFVSSGSGMNSCGALLNVFPIAFRLEPKAEETVRVVIDAAPSMVKECWDIVFVQDVPSRVALTRTGLRYELRTGVKIYVVPQGLKRDAAITGMSLESPDARPIASPGKSAAAQRINVRFNNTGGVHVVAKGRIEIRRADNSVAVQLPIAEFPTLPGATRKLEVDVPAGLSPGTYIALALIDFGGAEIAAGQIEISVP